jgi:phosphatidylinositol alpha-1,6-mannosyltransferase
MKRTLLLTHEYYPFHGGVANYCYGLFSHLPEQNYIVVTDMKANAQNQAPLTTYSFPLLSRMIRPRWLLGLWTVSRLIRKEKIELVVTPNIFPLGQLLHLVCRWQKIPYIISLHGLDIRLALKKNKRLAIRILKDAQHVIVNSQSTAEIINKHIAKEACTIITPYLHTSAPTKATAKERQHSSINLITVGRLTKRKGHDIVIQALQLLNNPNLHYTIIGAGPEEQNLRDLIQQWKLTNNVVIKTKISDEELQRAYQQADIFIMPTRNIGDDVEGYGIVYLEAASYQLPIIGSQGTSVEEIFNTTSALLTDGTRPETVASAISQLLDPKERQRLGSAAFATFQKLPNWQQKAAILADLLS